MSFNVRHVSDSGRRQNEARLEVPARCQTDAVVLDSRLVMTSRAAAAAVRSYDNRYTPAHARIID